MSYSLAGDASYTQHVLPERQVVGVSPDESESLRTLETILRYAHDRRMVYLPTHDPESAGRLANAVTVAADG